MPHIPNNRELSKTASLFTPFRQSVLFSDFQNEFGKEYANLIGNAISLKEEQGIIVFRIIGTQTFYDKLRSDLEKFCADKNINCRILDRTRPNNLVLTAKSVKNPQIKSVEKSFEELRAEHETLLNMLFYIRKKEETSLKSKDERAYYNSTKPFKKICDKLIDTVASIHEVVDVRSKRKRKMHARVREICFYLMSEGFGLKNTEAVDYIKRGSSRVAYSSRVVKELIKKDKQFLININNIIKKIIEQLEHTQEEKLFSTINENIRGMFEGKSMRRLLPEDTSETGMTPAGKNPYGRDTYYIKSIDTIAHSSEEKARGNEVKQKEGANKDVIVSRIISPVIPTSEYLEHPTGNEIFSMEKMKQSEHLTRLKESEFQKKFPVAYSECRVDIALLAIIFQDGDHSMFIKGSNNAITYPDNLELLSNGTYYFYDYGSANFGPVNANHMREHFLACKFTEKERDIFKSKVRKLIGIYNNLEGKELLMAILKKSNYNDPEVSPEMLYTEFISRLELALTF